METKIPTPEEYEQRVSYKHRMLLYNLTTLSSCLYSMWYDLHNELRVDDIRINKKLVKSYKTLGNLCNRMSDCLLHLCPIEKCSDSDQNIHIMWADIFESYLKCLMNIMITLPVEQPDKFMKLFNYMHKLNKQKVITYEQPDWENMMNLLNVKPEKDEKDEL